MANLKTNTHTLTFVEIAPDDGHSRRCTVSRTYSGAAAMDCYGFHDEPRAADLSILPCYSAFAREKVRTNRMCKHDTPALKHTRFRVTGDAIDFEHLMDVNYYFCFIKQIT